MLHNIASRSAIYPSYYQHDHTRIAIIINIFNNFTLLKSSKSFSFNGLSYLRKSIFHSFEGYNGPPIVDLL